MASVLDRFLREHPAYQVAVVGSFPRWISDMYPGRVVDCNRLDVAGIGYLAVHSDYLLGVDSWVLHLADLAGVPSVGIFGPDRVHEWGFRFRQLHRAIVGESRLENVSEDAVYEALTAVMNVKFIRTLNRGKSG